MFLIDTQSAFQFAYSPVATALAEDFVFVYQNGELGLTDQNQIPLVGKACKDQTRKWYCFGHIDNRQCLLPLEAIEEISSNLNYVAVRYSHKQIGRDLFQAVAIGHHLDYWRKTHRYCGMCANPMQDKINERARLCPKCHYLIYPKISPCVIVLVKRDESFLLARSSHFSPGVMSTLAGFVEIGESIEQAVIREVKEEVGIMVHQLQYICSQPWPFPDSLMLGFVAEYQSGELLIDKNEIEAAAWFSKDNLPTLPNEMSIARYLIEHQLKSSSVL